MCFGTVAVVALNIRCCLIVYLKPEAPGAEE
jgi:hypothetical protein